MRHELRPVIGSKMLWNAFHHHHVGQRFDHLRARPAPFHPNNEGFARMLVDQVQRACRPAVMGAYAHEVVAPHMVAVRRPQPNARSIVEPQPTAWLLLLRYLQPLAPPDPLHAILAHLPARMHQQGRDAPVAVTAILAGQNNDGLCESIFVFALCWPVALRAAWLLHHTARPAFAHPVLKMSMIHRTAPSLRA